MAIFPFHLVPSRPIPNLHQPRNTMNRFLFPLLFSLLLWLWACGPQPVHEGPPYLAQGMMAGEVTSGTAIFQARLTQRPDSVGNDYPGMEGVGRFEWSPDSSWEDLQHSPWLSALPSQDYILKYQAQGLTPGTRYYYRLRFGPDSTQTRTSYVAHVRSLPGRASAAPVSFVVVTGMNYYMFHHGKYDSTQAYDGPDKSRGYPALATMARMAPDYFIGTGDNVYFDHPNEGGFRRALERGQAPAPGIFGGAEVTTEAGMRQKYHVQFSQPRYVELFAQLGTYWEKDDHDYRFNDADTLMEHPISHSLGIKNFKEQLPVVPPKAFDRPTYRTHRMNRDLQIWLLEGRDYRSPNAQPDGPEKTLWGKTQREWLKQSLLQSDAMFKVIISPTPMVGPDDAYKRDNHTNPEGFRYERDQFFAWLNEHKLLEQHTYVVCGDRHWQYHAIHPSGVEEFSCGALVDNNSRAGRTAGDPNSTDPEGNIQQPYLQATGEQASGGFLLVRTHQEGQQPSLHFEFYDEQGSLQYEAVKK